MPKNGTTIDTWFVIASTCDCNHVAITVMDRSLVADDSPDDNETIRTGTDWRTLVTEAATAMANRTGNRISGTCTAVYVHDDTERQRLENDLVTHVHRLADNLAHDASPFA